MKQTLEITHHVDAGHGWLQVPKHIIAQLGLQPSTKFSYQDDTSGYLEEDMDGLALMVKAQEAGIASTVTVNRHQGDCFVRKLAKWSPQPEPKLDQLHEFVLSHIEASNPCSVQSVLDWADAQGLDSAMVVVAIAEFTRDRRITFDFDFLYPVIELLTVRA